MSKPSLVIIIAEDESHKRLVYRYLLMRGLREHAIRIELSPAGEGSAEKWVRSRFVKEMKEFRRRSQRAQTALIVIIDADVGTVENRLRQLDQALEGMRRKQLMVRGKRSRDWFPNAMLKRGFSA